MRTIEAVMSRSDCARDVDTAPPRRPQGASDPDAGLVERLRRQEEGAAEALLAAYGNRVYRLALRITGNSSDAEEVVQDALWAATRKIDTFLGTAAFGSWIYRITANAACQKRRRRRVERAEVAWDDLGPSFDELGQHVQPGLDWSPRLKDPALQTELRTVLSAAIEALPEEYRAVLLLHDVEGLSSPEISEALQIKLGTIKSRAHRARLFVRSRLADYMERAPEPR
jgi:RNA polymerase sigma-70 factor (ECF subfamily)